MRTPVPLECNNIALKFHQVDLYFPIDIKVIVARIIFTLPIITATTRIFLSECCLINKVSTWFFVTFVAAQFFPPLDAKIY